MTCIRIIDKSVREPLPAPYLQPRILLRVDQAHVKRVIKARRDLCIGEDVKAVKS